MRIGELGERRVFATGGVGVAGDVFDQRIIEGLLETLTRSGLRADEVDAVVRTGGSAQTPCFIEMMTRIFGPEKVVLSDVFSSVTAGLTIHAYADVADGHVYF